MDRLLSLPRPGFASRAYASALTTVVALFAILFLVAVPTQASASGPIETVTLQRGSNEVIYRGPALPAQMIATQIPHLVAIHRWNAATQRHESIAPELPTATAGWIAQPGDVLWVSVRAPSAWEMPIVGDPSGTTLAAGWNVFAWPAAEPNPRKLLDALEDRLRGIWVPDLATGQLQLYTPDQPDSASALHSLRTDSIVWMLITAGPDVTLTYGAGGSGLSGAALAGSAAGLPTALDNLEVQQAVVHIQTVTTAGAGFIIERGEILTAAHVVGLATHVTVRFFDGSTAVGTVAARDDHLDLALIRVDEMAAGVRRLAWQQRTQPQLTQGIWAWGFPYEASLLQAGFSVSVSVVRGIVSAIRVSDGVSYLQTDAALNPGNSGGPVTLADGRLVGIATNTFSIAGADVEGIQFAVDLTQHQAEIEALRAAP